MKTIKLSLLTDRMLTKYSLLVIYLSFLFNLNISLNYASPLETNTTATVKTDQNQTTKLVLNNTVVNITSNVTTKINNYTEIAHRSIDNPINLTKTIEQGITTVSSTLITNKTLNDTKIVQSNSSLTASNNETKVINIKDNKQVVNSSTTTTTTASKTTEKTTIQVSKNTTSENKPKNDKPAGEKLKDDKLEDNGFENNDEDVEEEEKPEEPNMENNDTEKKNRVDSKYDSKPEKPIVDSSKDSQPELFDDESTGPGFLTYFLVLSALFIVGYIAYHNKSKILGILVEGRPRRRYQRLNNN